MRRMKVVCGIKPVKQSKKQKADNMSAQEILSLIENVDPADTAKLDEIDFRVNHYIVAHRIGYEKPYCDAWKQARIRNADCPQYTRSRDALKAIRPEGWNLEIKVWGKSQARCTIWKRPFCDTGIRFSRWLPTEELAELHCIIKAIEHERTKGETK